MSDVYIPQGRPSTLTDAVADKLVALVETGHYNTMAARGAGVGPRSFQRWLALGEAADDRLSSGQPIEEREERYWHLWQRISKAQAKAADDALTAIRAAWESGQQWTAAAWYLERKYPGEWGRRTELNVGPSDRMLEVLATAISVTEPAGGEEDQAPAEPGTTVTTVTVAPDALEPPG
jgi:transposase